MRNRHRIQKADEIPAETSEGTKPTHRLTGITVKEVSVVDRAANKRKYLLVKEDETNKALPQTPDLPAPPQGTNALRITPELKTKVMGALQDAQEHIGRITKVLEGSSETPGVPPPQELMDALTQLANMFLQSEGTPGTQPATPPTAATKTAEGATGGTEPAEKAGRKLSAARLAQLQAAHETISALLAEVSEEKPADAKPAEGDAASTEKNAPPAPPAAPAIDVHVNALRGEMTAMSASIGESLKKMTMVFEHQNARIEDLSKARGSSAQVDLDAQHANTQPKKLVWDMDMAAPRKTFQ